MGDYYREQDRLYSKHSYGNDIVEFDSQYGATDIRPMYRSKNFLSDSHGFFDRMKSKLNIFRGDEDDGSDSSIAKSSSLTRQAQLWNAIKCKPIKLVLDNDFVARSHTNIPGQSDPVLESANTFLTVNNQNYERNSNSPSKRDTGCSVPLSGSPFANTGITDFIGFENDGNTDTPISPWDKIHVKSTFKGSTTLQTIQKRLLQISARKQEVAKSYQKLLKELSEWWQDTIEAEESMELICDLQKLFHEDLVFEQRLSNKLKEVSKALEFTKMREEEMLQERKEVQHTMKKYGQIKCKRGNHSEEAHFLKERVVTRQNSLMVITGHYQQSLSTTARELFVNASVEYFETASDIKSTSKDFFQNSVNYLRDTNAGNIEQHIDDLRRKRADKHWSKLTPQERDDPNRLVEIMSDMYNGQDSLMCCINRKPLSKSPAKLNFVADKENQPQPSSQRELKLEFKTGLEDSSQLASESNIRSDLEDTCSKRSDYGKKCASKRNLQPLSLDSNRTLRCEGVNRAIDYRRRSRLPYPDTSETIRAHIENLRSGLRDSNTEFGLKLSAHNDGGTILDLSPGNDDFQGYTYEPEQELNRNKWIESPGGT
ncbi:LADA_0B02036g1_1 [Lachancea dasiensis]|uniref:LADA_0B02036g1_1 n=1 Tax=Lachancea dasiensis TaxID=1072105 RepID=A0A1G4IS39_9SACH|nr:LADA_0B02036g1_1 [Lachancea dasiensis]